MRWIIAAPAWGERCVSRFIDAALPSYRAAMAYAGIEASLIVHTDAPVRIREAARGIDIICPRPPGNGDKYRQYADAQLDALQMAVIGDRVVLLTADMVVSRELFSACAARFEQGKKAIAICGPRTLSDRPPPAGLSSAELRDWTIAHFHPSILGSFWGGRSLPPSSIFFRRGDNITMRGFHLHPVAIVKDRELAFAGTPDQDCLEAFAESEIHVVTDRDEFAACEMSPADLHYSLAREPIGVAAIARWLKAQRPINWWLSQHRIIFAGNGDTDDVAVWEQLAVERLKPEPIVRPPQRRVAAGRR